MGIFPVDFNAIRLFAGKNALRAGPPPGALLPGRSDRIMPAMHDIPVRIADVLLRVEAILRSHGLWETTRPAAAALASDQPFCIDTLRFEQWLQWVFLPRMKNILEQARPLPLRSGIFSYAEENLNRHKPPGADLLKQIRCFDELIAIHAGARSH